MKIKPKTYYKIYYHEDKEWYDILYTGNKWIYIVAEQFGTRPLEKHDKKRKWGYLIADKYNNIPLIKYDKKIKWFTINDYQDYIDMYSIKIKELTKEEVFLELL